MSDCYRIGVLGVLFLLFQTCGSYAFIDIFGIYYAIYWIYGYLLDLWSVKTIHED